jgi:hypothetical protein
MFDGAAQVSGSAGRESLNAELLAAPEVLEVPEVPEVPVVGISSIEQGPPP